MDIIEVKSINKTFKLSKKQANVEKSKSRTRVAVKDLSFTIKKGEIYSLLGPNGAGKTTALRCIAGLISPDTGDIYINGKSVKNEKLKTKSKIAFLTGDMRFDESFTPNYLFKFFSNLHGIDKNVAKQRKKELFSIFGIDKFSEVKISDMSTGMKQKASIAISLVNDPEYIIFDEPTNGLDITTARVILEYLKKLRDKGKGVLLSTHIMSLAQKISDKVGIIIDGEKIVEGTIDDFKKDHQFENEFDLEDYFFTLLSKVKGEK